MRTIWLFIAAFGAAPLSLAGCSGGESAALANRDKAAAENTVDLSIVSNGETHRFVVKVAGTEAEQQKGLMFRTDIPDDGGMLFAPYPPGGGAPRVATFWMKNTPSPLDIIFIRPDHTIARIADNTVPFSETPVDSGEPVSAVLELRGGRAAELGIDEGDKVNWDAPAQ
ncbi:DUF192 domain-containing protein [Stakelama pacifica]|uniref:DUF192 domain-containing protein n=1 Tax=Stakelama pacifica TaxID=517720 RepID=A0A4R6FUL3_9SPHN|nr:DUF192 domain-containing protein [Stakelama pacifica]TDN84634.1 hypothetical protein EV664_103280 [Stakelama pacifica]GGO93233.1 hypothetical protein GCM10011329_12170 [Stakelama pacifica]